MRILLVDDEPSVRRALERALTLDGHEVDTAVDGAAALDRLAGTSPDVVVLDVMMPPPDGLEVCRRLRAGGDRTPVLMLTALGSVEDRVGGLDAGADDYLVKPFALDELRARLRALARRSAGSHTDAKLLRFCDLELDLGAYLGRRGDRTFELTRTEFALLELLMRRPGQVLTRELIFERVWDYDFGGSGNALEVYVGYLRRKTEEGGASRLIQTVRGVGYVMRER